MNSTVVYNRVLAGVFVALLGPLIDQKLGIKLTDAQLTSLVACAPIVYHAFAAFAQKCVNAFVMYFPPKQPGHAIAPEAPK